MDFRGLQRRIGYEFDEPALLERALTHSSYANEKGGADNERMEFLGDSLLGFIIGEHLFEKFPECPEGELSMLKSVVVSGEVLAGAAEDMGLGGDLLLGRGEEKTGGRGRDSILAGAFEALVCALYLDGGFERARRMVMERLAPAVNKIDGDSRGGDFKGLLQEYLQSESGLTPDYIILGTEGREHRKIFRAAVLAGGKVLGEGAGRGRKEAEKEAAKKAWESIGPDGGKRAVK